MRFYVEPSPAGGYFVRLAGYPAPVSRHDTEEEAQERVTAYMLGATGEATDEPADEPRPRRFASLRDGTQVIVSGTGDAGVGATDPRSGDCLGAASGQDDGIAVAVLDEWQHRGLGAALVDELVRRGPPPGGDAPTPERFRRERREGTYTGLVTGERAQAYGRVMRTLEHVGEAKLQPSEQDRVREAADTLLFSEQITDPGVRGAHEDIEALARNLADSERWTPERAQQLVDDVAACGPVAPVG